MIPKETQYEIYNIKLLAIIKTFKIWQYYIKDYKYKIFVFTYYHNLYYFIDIKKPEF